MHMSHLGVHDLENRAVCRDAVLIPDEDPLIHAYLCTGCRGHMMCTQLKR